MSIKCGNKIHIENTYHATIADVRACFAGAKGGEATYGDVILTDSENIKIAAGIRDMESEGILPRRALRREDHPAYGRQVTHPTREDASEALLAQAQHDRYRAQPPQTSPKGREIAEGFGGSPKQFDFIYDLLEQLGGVSESFRWDVIVSVRLASAEIDRLKDRVREERSTKVRNDYYAVYSDGSATDAPPAPAPVNDLAETDGIFRNPETGEIFKGQFNRAQGDGRRLYFKRLVLEQNTTYSTEKTNSIPLSGQKSPSAHLSWEYAGGAQRAGVKADWLMSREDAEKFGALYGICVRCHRDLTKEESIERAMGPICAGKQGW